MLRRWLFFAATSYSSKYSYRSIDRITAISSPSNALNNANQKVDFLNSYLAVRLITATVQIKVIVGVAVLLNLLPLLEVGCVFVVPD